MSERRYEADEREASRYRYPGTDVFVNLADLRKQEDLDAFERQQVTRQLLSLPPFDPTSYAAFKNVHKHLFGTVYAWAGTERTYPTGRGAAPFCRPEYIVNEMEKRFAEIRADRELTNDVAAIFAARAAGHISEINAIHPFLEGNGRVLRVLLNSLAERTGLKFSVAGIPQSDWYAASEAGFLSQDYTLMTAIVLAHLRRVGESAPPASV